MSTSAALQPLTASGTPSIQHSSKHLVMELAIGSKEGTYDLALLSETGAQILGATGTAKLEDHNVTLRADLDVTGVRPGAHLLALRQPGLEWTRYPVRVL